MKHLLIIISLLSFNVFATDINCASPKGLAQDFIFSTFTHNNDGTVTQTTSGKHNVQLFTVVSDTSNALVLANSNLKQYMRGEALTTTTVTINKVNGAWVTAYLPRPEQNFSGKFTIGKCDTTGANQ